MPEQVAINHFTLPNFPPVTTESAVTVAEIEL
jgi:hypothetical protein